MRYSREECIEFVESQIELYTDELEHLEETRKRYKLTDDAAEFRRRVAMFYRDVYKAILDNLEGGNNDDDDRK